MNRRLLEPGSPIRGCEDVAEAEFTPGAELEGVPHSTVSLVVEYDAVLTPSQFEGLNQRHR